MNNIASKKRGVRRLFRKLLLAFACNVSLIPSKGVRPWLCRFAGLKIAEPWSVFIGKGVHFDDISPENITIGRNVRITSGVSILNHFLDVNHIPTEKKPFQFLNGKVVIGDNVFIGLNTIICKPVMIGRCVIIGAGSVVTKDLPRNSVVVGVPARVIGKYGNEENI